MSILQHLFDKAAVTPSRLPPPPAPVNPDDGQYPVANGTPSLGETGVGGFRAQVQTQARGPIKALPEGASGIPATPRVVNQAPATPVEALPTVQRGGPGIITG
jgi:hypothetical protein